MLNKTIKTTMVTLGAVVVLGISGLTMCNMYSTIQDMTTENQELKDKYIELIQSNTAQAEALEDQIAKYDDLQNQVYNVMNGKDYEIHIEHEGLTCNYRKQYGKKY